MKFTRQHTAPGTSPFEGVQLVAVSAAVGSAACSHRAESAGALTIEFPADWSSPARNVCLDNCFVLDGIACDLAVVAEDDVPAWLWRHVPEETSGSWRGESSLCQVIDRIVGGWTYLGWKGGYFDSEEDAQVFYDEWRWLLVHQKASPSIRQWRYGGRHWAYGHDVSAASTCLVDYRSGTVRRAEPTELPPQGLIINSASDALTGEGSVWDLWRRESEVLSHGGHCGANVSAVRSVDKSVTGPALASLLDAGDAMARASLTEDTANLPKRRITIDGVHPESRPVAERPLEKMAAAEADAIGSMLARRHVQAILDACLRLPPQKGRKRPDPQLTLALQCARQALLSEQLIERTLTLADSGLARTADDVLGHGFSVAAQGDGPAGTDAVTVIRLDDDALTKAASGDGHLGGLLRPTVVVAASGMESGIHFRSTAEAWNTCGQSGTVRSASGDGSFMFLDDTASDPWFVNAFAFVDAEGAFDVAGFQHTAGLLTVAADISLMAETAITPRLARRVWDFRPLALSLTGLGRCLMASGTAYDSASGRAFCASLGALLTSTAYRVSAQMAEELGRFPEFDGNSEDMLRVLDLHSDMVAGCVHESLPTGLVEAIEESWSETVRAGETGGFRNAQISVLVDADDIALLLDGGAAGLRPMARLVASHPTSTGYWTREIDQAVCWGLRAVGYGEEKIADIVRHVVGRGTLANAPGVNHETLRKRGFTRAAIDAVETALSQIDDISAAFSPFVLGADYCRHMLGFTEAELEDDGFDMLSALGYSDAAIEAANIYCCGAETMEGAPHLAPEHLAVFDCADPKGARGARSVNTTAIVRMMGALQPHISGAIGQVLQMPAEASPADYRAAIQLAWRLKLKSITLQRRQPDTGVVRPLLQSDGIYDAPLPTFAVVPGVPAPAASPREIPSKAEIGIPPDTLSESAVADGADSTADGAQASRHASSHAARSAASVPSSADAVVEQRHV